METLKEGDKVQTTDVMKNHRHLKNQIGTVISIGGAGYAYDDVMVKLDSGGTIFFKVRELTELINDRS